MLDFILMEGSPTLLPWQKKMKLFRLLFQMCKLTNKPLYASGFGIQLLANYCAVGTRKLTVINGLEKGGDLNSLDQYDASSYSGNEVFLDNCTGDFFESHEGQWRASGNIGMHWVNALGIRSMQVKRAFTYSKKVQNYQPILIATKMTDTKSHIMK